LSVSGELHKFDVKIGRMFKKEEEKQIRLDFWQELNVQFQNMRGAHGNKVSWTNFNTRIRHLYFRMEADQNGARLCIDLQFPDADIRGIFYEQFQEFEEKLTSIYGKALKWYPVFDHSNGKTISRIAVEQEGTNLFRRSDWPEMQQFLLTQFKALEKFWAMFNDVFIQLKN